MASDVFRWAGFERSPRGRLLRQHVDLDQPLGIAYERSVGYVKEDHVHDRHMIVCPRGAAVMDVVAGGRRHRVDSRHLLWVPERTVHADEAVTTLYDTLAIYPDTRLFAAAGEGSDLRRLATDYVVARRTRLFDDLLEAFFFARVVGGGPTEPFQDRQLVREALGAILKEKRPREAFREDSSDVAERAIRHIEANLFLPLDLRAIGAHAGASTSTLLRAFRRAFGTTPGAYVKTRRLEEARHLLAGGKHAVGEVALLVGYEDFAAFSKAFRRQFGRSPREMRRR